MTQPKAKWVGVIHLAILPFRRGSRPGFKAQLGDSNFRKQLGARCVIRENFCKVEAQWYLYSYFRYVAWSAYLNEPKQGSSGAQGLPNGEDHPLGQTCLGVTSRESARPCRSRTKGSRCSSRRRWKDEGGEVDEDENQTKVMSNRKGEENDCIYGRVRIPVELEARKGHSVSWMIAFISSVARVAPRSLKECKPCQAAFVPSNAGDEPEWDDREPGSIYDTKLVLGYIEEGSPVQNVEKFVLDFVAERAIELRKVEEWEDLCGRREKAGWSPPSSLNINCSPKEDRANLAPALDPPSSAGNAAPGFWIRKARNWVIPARVALSAKGYDPRRDGVERKVKVKKRNNPEEVMWSNAWLRCRSEIINKIQPDRHVRAYWMAGWKRKTGDFGKITEEPTSNFTIITSATADDLGYKMDRGLRIFSHALTDVSRSSLHDPPIPTTNSRYLSSHSSSKGMQLRHPTGCTSTIMLSLDGRACETGKEDGSITYDLYVIDPSSLPSCGRTRRNLFDLKKYLQGFIQGATCVEKYALDYVAKGTRARKVESGKWRAGPLSSQLTGFMIWFELRQSGWTTLGKRNSRNAATTELSNGLPATHYWPYQPKPGNCPVYNTELVLEFIFKDGESVEKAEKYALNFVYEMAEQLGKSG
ncbi:hypothetical protein BGW80DRAFT_1523826 [Lactifluus volemus]|nr:hypothetical protein BGW80DRAFT_1523826 [Lactifluus volemus]